MSDLFLLSEKQMSRISSAGYQRNRLCDLPRLAIERRAEGVWSSQDPL
jgi:hypothetical protein